MYKLIIPDLYIVYTADGKTKVLIVLKQAIDSFV